MKTTVISTPERRILFVGKPFSGSTHDYTMIKTEFDPKQADWFMNKKVWIDLGYQGFDGAYSTTELHIPVKRKKRKKTSDPQIEFTEEEKNRNREVSSKRIYVEHAIGGMKRYRFLSDRLRCRDPRFYSIILGLCAGL